MNRPVHPKGSTHSGEDRRDCTDLDITKTSKQQLLVPLVEMSKIFFLSVSHTNYFKDQH